MPLPAHCSETVEMCGQNSDSHACACSHESAICNARWVLYTSGKQPHGCRTNASVGFLPLQRAAPVFTVHPLCHKSNMWLLHQHIYNSYKSVSNPNHKTIAWVHLDTHIHFQGFMRYSLSWVNELKRREAEINLEHSLFMPLPSLTLFTSPPLIYISILFIYLWWGPAGGCGGRME